MNRILGLDLGTNSIGWALIEQDFQNKYGKILGMGTRVIPMSQDILGEFGKGNSVSQTKDRTQFRSTRRLRERYLLRRERLHRVLNILNFLPQHYASSIDFEKRLGKFIAETEPKIAYKNSWDEQKNKKNYEFIFKDAFGEMLEDFRQHQPLLLVDEKGQPRLVPYDWTIYYLRKKALTRKIEKEALAWILLNFNQKRGYYQLRGEEEEENTSKSVEFHSLKVIEVIADETQKGKADTWYTLLLENGWKYRRSSKTPLFDWKNKVRDFIVTTELNDDGSVKTDKEGNEKRSFRAPGEDDWTLLKKKTEQEIAKSKHTVGEFIYDALLKNPQQKIKGKLVRTIERKFYKDELRQILQKQKEFHPELQNEELYSDCIRELYRNNEGHRELLNSKEFVHLFLDDIIFYQRPLRSQKSSIGNCTLEPAITYLDKGVEKEKRLKATPKSNPYYQEFRLWQWICNLSIYKKENDSNVTTDFLSSPEDAERLFDFLNNRKNIEQKTLLKYFLEQKGFKGKLLAAETEKFRWNYVEDKDYPCNETAALINSRLEKIEGVNPGFLTREIMQQLWHIIYSVTDKIDYEKALKTFAQKHLLPESGFVESFRKFPPFKSEYASFSEKAIKKLLPLMRLGKHWSWDSIDKASQLRIEKLLTGEYDPGISDRVREKLSSLTKETDYQALPLWMAQYVVYNRHSEAASLDKWSSVADLEAYLQAFRQHSLRNPIVEQVIMETLRVVKDIWIQYGQGAKDFFNEIHVELGREMKNTKDDREKMSRQVIENENTNLRIKALLAEMMNDGQMQNIRPYSPMQQEILKIYEEGVLLSGIEIDDDILKISKTAQPSPADLRRYKLWLEQKYRSPYTGNIIPLNKLFTPEYEIEHIIPQSRYFDDSFSNKVICEAAVNKLKGNHIGLAFIKKFHGQKVECGLGTIPATIFEVAAYEEFVKQHYSKNRSKRNKLLLEEIPEKMIARQLNDTRYISKFISSLLSNIVRASENDDGVNSKNIIPGNGKITTELKQHWGLNDVWNELILPRFERMNALTNTSLYTAWSNNHQKFLPAVPLEASRGFSKKRIDHRHHAMDALVIACATRDHINLLNNKHADSPQQRFDLNRKLRKFKKTSYTHPQTGELIERDIPDDFLKPWESFTTDARNSLEKIIVSFKQNLRVINKATNHYEKYIEKEEGLVKSVQVQQGVNWAIRKPMHKDTVFGLVQLRRKKEVSLSLALDVINDITNKALRKELQSMAKQGKDKKEILKYFKAANNIWKDIDITRVEIFYQENDNVASRVSLDDSFDEKRIESITDTGIQKILNNHLANYKGRLDEKGKEIAPPLLAFSPEGVEELNKNIKALNKGKAHQPILKVRTYEPKGNKFNIGETGNKKAKYVVAAKGTNLFFAVYQGKDGKRNYETVPLNITIERQKQELPPVPLENQNGDPLLFALSPNDLVYVPSAEERTAENSINNGNFDAQRVANIYKVVSFTSNQIFFVRQDVATSIVNKAEFSALNKMERTINGTMIKEVCVKLNIDRLGHIKL
ncbi:type II CRISPR RNA-guided endonuclease Cas9 [Filimonas effusa]|uniref:CRISPR-associated endonuclease Cas9 n=1 Tax=Filimonas effusa TaxID=2508721 RepID=A0A4Q1D7M9_9BACT|nr:type II CRISPR RNA-guided endonuclease Cas9 [Filimonas effusa]RXK83761.1 type II CRISPR RNA-guided endonuclease Cas9 [Filimonas effusa]